MSKNFVIYVIDFDPIRVFTCLALQNDRQNLNFEKEIRVAVKTMARNDCKMAKHKSCQFFSEQTLVRGIMYLDLKQNKDEWPFV